MVKTQQKKFLKDGRELEIIVFSVATRQGDNVDAQLELLVDRLYQWYKKYGDACREFTIRFSGPVEHHDTLLAYLPKLIQQETPLHPLFAQLGQVNVVFLSTNGIIMKETKLMIG
jgi:hypothetical protein